MGNRFYGDFGGGFLGWCFFGFVWWGFFLDFFFILLFLLLFIIATDYLIPKEEACREENEEK